MPGPVIPSAGLQNLMEQIMARINNGGQSSALHLFANDITPGMDTVAADFVENDFDGYAAIPLPLAVDNGVTEGQDIWTFPLCVFASTGVPLPQLTYGYWVDCIRPTTGGPEILWAPRFPNPWAWTAPGQSLPIPLTLGDMLCAMEAVARRENGGIGKSRHRPPPEEDDCSEC